VYMEASSSVDTSEGDDWMGGHTHSSEWGCHTKKGLR
jgi:hypothetical protein